MFEYQEEPAVEDINSISSHAFIVHEESAAHAEPSFEHFSVNPNKLNLVFSRSGTDKYDRKKVEFFWKYFDANVGLQELLEKSGSQKISKEIQSQCSTKAETDPHLYGTMKVKTAKRCDSQSLKYLEMLKSHHLDKVALAGFPPVKRESSPYLADEIVDEGKVMVKAAIDSFELAEKNRPAERIKRSECRRESYMKINRLGLNNIE